MRKYLIERTVPGAGQMDAAALEAIAGKSNSVLRDLGSAGRRPRGGCRHRPHDGAGDVVNRAATLAGDARLGGTIPPWE